MKGCTIGSDRMDITSSLYAMSLSLCLYLPMLHYSLEFSTETLEEDYIGANSPFNDDLTCHLAILGVLYSDSKA
jgi:hypothetical protein